MFHFLFAVIVFAIVIRLKILLIASPFIALRYICAWIGNGFNFRRTREALQDQAEENRIRGQEYRRKALEEYVRTGKKLPGHW